LEVLVIIREAQMDRLGDSMFNAFVGRMAVRLRAACPAETQSLDDNALRTRIRKEVGNANGFGIEQEQNLETYLEYAIRWGTDFYEAPPFLGARRVLEDELLDETEKMNRVNEYLVFR
jgi:hypothetical protein